MVDMERGPSRLVACLRTPMNLAIASILERAKALVDPRVELALTRRVRTRDSACAGHLVEVLADGWTFWIDDDGADHLSHPDYIEVEK